MTNTTGNSTAKYTIIGASALVVDPPVMLTTDHLTMPVLRPRMHSVFVQPILNSITISGKKSIFR